MQAEQDPEPEPVSDPHQREAPMRKCAWAALFSPRT